MSLLDDDGSACVPETSWARLAGISQFQGTPLPSVPNTMLDVEPHADGGAAFIGRFYFEATFGEHFVTTNYPAGFVARVLGRVDADGNVAWAKTINDGVPSEVSKVATGGDGTIAVLGSFANWMSVDDLRLDRVVTPGNPGGAVTDTYLVTFDVDGTVRWGRVLGDDRHSDWPTALTILADGTVVATILSLGGVDEGRVAAFDPDGTPLWSHSIVDWSPSSLAATSDGELIVAGTHSGEIPIQGGGSVSTAGLVLLGIGIGEDAPRRVTSDPSWSGLSASGLALAADGTAYVSGTAASAASFGDVALAVAGRDGFVAAFTSDLEPAWIAGLSGSGQESARDVELDASGNVVVTGNFSADVTLGALALDSGGSGDAFLAWLSSDGDPIELVNAASGPGYTSVAGLAVTNSGTIVTAGLTRGTTSLGTSVGFQNLFLAGVDCEPLVSDFAVAADSLAVDRVGPGDAGLAVDGVPDGVFEVTVRGPVASLSLVPVFPDGSLYSYWHYDTVVGDTPIASELDDYWSTGAQTWVLGVFDADSGALLNDADGSLSLGAGVHHLVLHGTDVELHGRGLSWRLAVEREDGSIEWSDIVTDGALVQLDALVPAPSADRVGPGDLGLAPDGACDVAFDLTLTGRVRSLALISTDEAGNAAGGQQWDTIVGDTSISPELGTGFPFGAWTWALGVFEGDEPFALNPDGPLIDDRNLWTRTVRVFGAASISGDFRVVAELHDGSLVASPVADAGPDCFDFGGE